VIEAKATKDHNRKCDPQSFQKTVVNIDQYPDTPFRKKASITWLAGFETIDAIAGMT
jgi:hypothetical protein